MELCATNQEQPRLQQSLGDPDDVHITSTLLDSFEEDLAEQKIVTTKLLKADLSKCVVNSQGDLLENLSTPFGNEEFSADETDASDKEEEENVKSMLEMFNILHARKRVNYEALVLNRHSFSQTAANILTLSLLVKDGRAEVETEKNASFFIVPGNVVSEPSSEDTMSFMYDFTHKDWQRMQRHVKAGDELMMSNPPPVKIPKGTRKKARKRTFFNKNNNTEAMTFCTTSGPEKLDNSTKKAGDSTGVHQQAGDSTEVHQQDESKAPGNDEINIIINNNNNNTGNKYNKPLLTFSRRPQKKSGEISSLQLLKRYSRRMLDDGGYARTKTLLFFEEFIKNEKKKSGEDSSGASETIFERLAKAPRRRRTGCSGAAMAPAQPPGSSEVNALQVFTANDTKLKDEEKPIVIAPKRFKKSVFGPRQALIARIKARLKAILKHQPVPPAKK